ncbi:MAG: penicillin-binding transpeptidase domain-containing protein, partial [Clostridia bacterium]
MQNTVLTSKKRLSALLIATVFIFLCIFLRLAYIQVVWGKDLQSRAQDQWNRDLPLSAMRGDIVDTNGVVIATSVTAYSVYVRPKSITDPVKVAEVLSSALHIDYQIIYDKATRKGVSDITISRQVAYDVANTIRSANLNGVYLSSESAREYVYGNFLSQVLGFVSVDNVGQTGLEAYYNKYLTGINGKLLTQSDLIGKELSGEPMEYIPATDGLDVVLTIDYVIQSYVEQALDVIMQAYSPKNAKCLVIDVTNGDVLAMCVKPSVNLNNIDRSDVGLLMELSRNSLVTDIYEPGSTFKVVTTAATLEESLKGNKKAFDENYVFRNNSRTRIINGSKISCWSTHANGKHANQTISQALNNSCNPIFTDIA